MIFSDFLVIFWWFFKHLEVSPKKRDFFRNSVSPARDAILDPIKSLKNYKKSSIFLEKSIPHGNSMEKRDFLKS